MGYYENWLEAMGQLTSMPSYESPYKSQIDSAQNKVENWSYDPNQDASYKAYEQLYTNNGKRAMQDTLGQVSARTGGLASSYAQSAAQQTYDGYMKQLASVVPTLENQAYNRAMNDLSYWQNKDDTEYARWKDTYNKRQNDVNFWWNWYQQELAELAAQGYGGGGSGYGGGGGYGSDEASDEYSIYTDPMYQGSGYLPRTNGDGGNTATSAPIGAVVNAPTLSQLVSGQRAYNAGKNLANMANNVGNLIASKLSSGASRENSVVNDITNNPIVRGNKRK